VSLQNKWQELSETEIAFSWFIGSIQKQNIGSKNKLLATTLKLKHRKDQEPKSINLDFLKNQELPT